MTYKQVKGERKRKSKFYVLNTQLHAKLHLSEGIKIGLLSYRAQVVVVAVVIVAVFAVAVGAVAIVAVAVAAVVAIVAFAVVVVAAVDVTAIVVCPLRRRERVNQLIG